MRPLEGTGPLGPLLPDHISEFVVGLVLFAIIVVVCYKVVVPRFEKMYTERADAIRGGIDRADQAQAEAQAALAKYQQQLAEANAQAAKIRDDARAAGQQITADMATKAQHEAERIVANARVQVEAERSHVVESLRQDLGGMATTLAGKIVGESLEDDARMKRTIDSFIASLEADNAKVTV